jgi:hypothetical protein
MLQRPVPVAGGRGGEGGRQPLIPGQHPLPRRQRPARQHPHRLPRRLWCRPAYQPSCLVAGGGPGLAAQVRPGTAGAGRAHLQHVRRPQQDCAARAQRAAQQFGDLASERGLEVDQHVPAEDQVEARLAARRERVVDQVVPAEPGQRAQPVGDDVGAVGLPFQVAVAQLRIQRPDRPRPVAAGFRGGDHGAGDVGAEDVDRRCSGRVRADRE